MLPSVSNSPHLDHERSVYDSSYFPTDKTIAPGDLWRCGLSQEEVRSCARNIFTTAKALQESCYHEIKPLNPQYDHFEESCAVLERGKHWLIEPLRELQPRSYAVLAEESTTLQAGFRAFFMDHPVFEVWTFHFQCLFVRERAILVEPYLSPAWSPECRGANKYFENDHSIPDVLLKTWCFRIAGWRLLRCIPWSPVDGTAAPLPRGPGEGTGINEHLSHMGAAFKKKHLPAFKERFGVDAVTKVFDIGRVAFRCFIDTRPPETKRAPGGDQLFLHRGRSDKVVYHVHGGRYDELRVLAPEHLNEAFDRYFAHVLSRTPGEFDFLPYSRVL